MPTKQWAEKAAALEAIHVLHGVKELDHRLMPIVRKTMEDGDGEGGDGEKMIKDAGTQKRCQMYKKEVSLLMALKERTISRTLFPHPPSLPSSPTLPPLAHTHTHSSLHYRQLHVSLIPSLMPELTATSMCSSCKKQEEEEEKEEEEEEEKEEEEEGEEEEGTTTRAQQAGMGHTQPLAS